LLSHFQILINRTRIILFESNPPKYVSLKALYIMTSNKKYAADPAKYFNQNGRWTKEKQVWFHARFLAAVDIMKEVRRSYTRLIYQQIKTDVLCCYVCTRTSAMPYTRVTYYQGGAMCSNCTANLQRKYGPSMDTDNTFFLSILLLHSVDRDAYTGDLLSIIGGENSSANLKTFERLEAEELYDDHNIAVVGLLVNMMQGGGPPAVKYAFSLGLQAKGANGGGFFSRMVGRDLPTLASALESKRLVKARNAAHKEAETVLELPVGDAKLSNRIVNYRMSSAAKENPGSFVNCGQAEHLLGRICKFCKSAKNRGVHVSHIIAQEGMSYFETCAICSVETKRYAAGAVIGPYTYPCRNMGSHRMNSNMDESRQHGLPCCFSCNKAMRNFSLPTQAEISLAKKAIPGLSSREAMGGKPAVVVSSAFAAEWRTEEEAKEGVEAANLAVSRAFAERGVAKTKFSRATNDFNILNDKTIEDSVDKEAAISAMNAAKVHLIEKEGELEKMKDIQRESCLPSNPRMGTGMFGSRSTEDILGPLGHPIRDAYDGWREDNFQNIELVRRLYAKALRVVKDELRTLTNPSDPKENDADQIIYLNLNSSVTNILGSSWEEAIAAYPVPDSCSPKERQKRTQNRIFIKWAIFTKYPYFVCEDDDLDGVGGVGNVNEGGRKEEKRQKL
jgi:hypothetical protein